MSDHRGTSLSDKSQVDLLVKRKKRDFVFSLPLCFYPAVVSMVTGW